MTSTAFEAAAAAAAVAASASPPPHDIASDYDSQCDSASLSASDDIAFLAPDDAFLPDAAWPFAADSPLHRVAIADALLLVIAASSAATTPALTALSVPQPPSDVDPLSARLIDPCFAWPDDALARVHIRATAPSSAACVELLALFGPRAETRLTLRSLHEIARHAAHTPVTLVFALAPRAAVPPAHERGVIAMRDTLAVLARATGGTIPPHGVLFCAEDAALTAACATQTGRACLRAFWGCAAHASLACVGETEEPHKLAAFEKSLSTFTLPDPGALRDAARKLFPADVGAAADDTDADNADDAASGACGADAALDVPRWREWAAEPFGPGDDDAGGPRCVVVLGGRGAGKTSVFRALVRAAGGSVVDGADETDVAGVRYVDTAALSGQDDDDESARDGCASVSRALAAATGPTKLVFVVRVAHGCVRADDAAAVRAVLRALESGHVDTGGRFCVVVNGSTAEEEEAAFVRSTRQWGEQLGETLARDGDGAMAGGGDVGCELLQKSAPVHYAVVTRGADGGLDDADGERLGRFVAWAPVVRIPAITSSWVEPQDVGGGGGGGDAAAL